MVVTIPSFKPSSLLVVLCFLLVGVSIESLSHLMIVDPYDSCRKVFFCFFNGKKNDGVTSSVPFDKYDTFPLPFEHRMEIQE